MSDEGENPAPTVLPSSTELFYFYGQTLEQCGKYTTGEPMKRLAQVFSKWLKVYSGGFLGSDRSMKLTNRRCLAFEHEKVSCWSEDAPNCILTARPDFTGRPFESRANPQEVKNACVVLNTAEYCQNTLTQLEERLKDMINPEFKDEISFEPERTNFTSSVGEFHPGPRLIADQQRNDPVYHRAPSRAGKRLRPSFRRDPQDALDAS